MGGFLDRMAQGSWQARNPDAFHAEQKQKQDDALKLQISPLTQAIAADRQKLTAFIDDKGNVIPEHQKDYDLTVKNMGDMLGRMRGLMGQGQPGEDPNHFESTIAGLTDKLHITRDLAHRLATKQSGKVNDWYAQNTQTAQDTAAGVLPYAMTPEGQGEAAKTADAIKVATARQKSTYENFKGPNGEFVTIDTATQTPPAGYVKTGNESVTAKVPKGLKAIEAGGVPVAVQDEDTGTQYLPKQLEPSGDAPPAAKEMWKTIQIAQEQKRIEQEKRDERSNAALSDRQNNMGTWSVAEGENGVTQLYNSKTGEVKDAPSGLHKSGYFAKQIAPLEAAGMNIDTYLDGKVYDGPGDLALQHEFFTATQPSTGFRMTKVQQDILQNSQSWLNSWKAKAYHVAHGTWFSDEQRSQIAKAAKDAIAAKKAVLSGGGPKTQELKGMAGQKKLTAKDLEDALQ